MLLNGPAARLAVTGDLVIVLSYCTLTEEEVEGFYFGFCSH